MPQGEAESARAEAARRLIAAASAGPGAAAGGPAQSAGRGGADRRRAAGDRFSALCVPRPAPDARRAAGEPQRTRPQTNGEIEAAVAAVEARLIAKPDDGKGWAVIAPVYMRLERYGDAAHAYAEALRLEGEDPLRRAAYGEALVAAAGGVVTDEARQAFDRALAEQPGQPQARFYLALGAEQDGKKAEAIRAYEQLVADSPSDAPWRGVVRARLAALKGEPAPAEASAGAGRPAIPDAQRPMIEGMVNRLASAARQQWRQRRRMVAPYSRLCGAA